LQDIDAEAKPTSKMVKLIEFDIIKRVDAGGDKAMQKSRINPRLRREKRRSTAFAHASMSAAGSRKKMAFCLTAVADKTSMLCSSARPSVSPPE
jgi:hypothetical protein